MAQQVTVCTAFAENHSSVPITQETQHYLYYLWPPQAPALIAHTHI